MQAYETTRQQFGQIVPQGANPNNSRTTYVNGAHGDLPQFTLDVGQAAGTVGYFLPSGGGVADILHALDETVSPTGLSEGLSAVLAGVDHPLMAVGYSEGTVALYQAAMSGGVPAGSTSYFNNPIISYEQAVAAQRVAGGPAMDPSSTTCRQET